MPSLERGSKRMVIAGASSLLGAELKSLLEESTFADWDFRLLDEEQAAGTLTEAGGEPAVIQPVEEGSFDKARLVFFSGSPEFTRINIGAATKSGARVIDLSGALVGEGETLAWFPGLERLPGRTFDAGKILYAIPSAAGTASSALTLALEPLGLLQLSMVFFQPVSEAGRSGIEELETQTGQLLSFQAVGHSVFDTQVAFNLLNRFGSSSKHTLSQVKERIGREMKALAERAAPLAAIQVLHAPVFYGTTFTASATVDPRTPRLHSEEIVSACQSAGFLISADSDAGPSNVSVAGENSICLGVPEADTLRQDTWWLWGAADNVRLPAANAVKLAKRLA